MFYDARQVRGFRGLEILSGGLIHRRTVMFLQFGFSLHCVGCVPPLLFAGNFGNEHIGSSLFSLFQ